MPKSVGQHTAVRADVIAIYGHIATENFEAAERFLDALEEAFERIALFPGSGRAYSASALKHFRLIQVPRFRNYLIFYMETKDDVRVLYVLHGRRDFPAILGDQPRD
jgi:toxin ParE1/3/4